MFSCYKYASHIYEPRPCRASQVKEYQALLDLDTDGKIDEHEFTRWYDGVQTAIKTLSDANGTKTVKALTEAIEHAYESYYPVTDHPVLEQAVENLRSIGGASSCAIGKSFRLIDNK